MTDLKKDYYSQLLSNEWKEKRQIILSRDNFKCTKCDSKKKLQVHHKYYLKNKKAWEYSNKALVTLCKCCHEKEHGIHNENKTESIKIKAKNKSKNTYTKSRKEKESLRVEKLYNSLSKKDKKLQDRYNNKKSV